MTNASRGLVVAGITSGVADLVTEMRQIKHPFEQGISAQRGIEF
jgi:ATP:corrinoid adenosyltransferase